MCSLICRVDNKQSGHERSKSIISVHTDESFTFFYSFIGIALRSFRSIAPFIRYWRIYRVRRCEWRMNGVVVPSPQRFINHCASDQRLPTEEREKERKRNPAAEAATEQQQQHKQRHKQQSCASWSSRRTLSSPCSEGTPCSGMPSSLTCMMVPGRVTSVARMGTCRRVGGWVGPASQRGVRTHAHFMPTPSVWAVRASCANDSGARVCSSNPPPPIRHLPPTAPPPLSPPAPPSPSHPPTLSPAHERVGWTCRFQ
jgi:hypothetical protein